RCGETACVRQHRQSPRMHRFPGEMLESSCGSERNREDGTARVVHQATCNAAPLDHTRRPSAVVADGQNIGRGRRDLVENFGNSLAMANEKWGTNFTDR